MNSSLCVYVSCKFSCKHISLNNCFYIYIYIYIYIYTRRAYDKFPDFFRMGTFTDSTHIKLKSPSK